LAVSVGLGTNPGFGTADAGTPGGPGLARRIPQAIVLADGSHHADTADRRTLNGDELAGHRTYAAPEPLLPRRARAPVNVPLALFAMA